MVEADWGLHDEPSSFGPRASEWEPVDSDRPADLLEVMAARAHGYSPASEAPLWCFVPAIWPSKARALGLPPRPAGRIWLLRAPEPYGAAQALLDDIWDGWRTSGAPAMATPEFVHYAQSRLHEIF